MAKTGIALSVGLILVLVPALQAADVVYDVRPASGVVSPVLVVPGETVTYEATISVSSGDNDGLNFFSFDLLTDLGVDQNTDSTDFDPVILSAFTFLGGPFLGTATGDDILGFEGTQGFGTSGTTGIGQGQPQVLVRGTLVTPAGATGLFTIQIGPDTNTNLLDTGGTNPISSSEINTTIGDGFVIETIPPDEDLDGDGVLNADDNCPGDANADQLDGDGDSVGDVCDSTPGGGDGGGGGGDGQDGDGEDDGAAATFGTLWDLFAALPFPSAGAAAGLFAASVFVGTLFGSPLSILIGVVWGLVMASTTLVAFGG